MDNKNDNPHDKRHKELLSNKKSFLSLLRDCIKESWVNDLDESSLHKTNKSFILQDFSEKEADIVYEAKISGTKIIFYILLELQSSVDYRMPYRLLLYIVEILRYYYNQADVDERDNKDFKFPIILPMVFFTGSRKWTVPLSLKDMFEDAKRFGNYVLNFDYMLLDAKGYSNEDLKNFSSKLLGVVLMLEKSKNDIEFYSNIRSNLYNIKDFDNEEKRILNMCIKIMDIAYGYNKGEEIKDLLNDNRIKEADHMLCDVIENAKLEREQLINQSILKGKKEGKKEGKREGKREGKKEGKREGILEGKKAGILEGKFEAAEKMLKEDLPIDLIIKITELSKEQITSLMHRNR